MLARIFDSTYSIFLKIASLVLVATALVSCVKNDPPLIADPAGTRETALPWNEQTKWERDGSAAGVNTEGRR
jgi:hypothetical protein